MPLFMETTLTSQMAIILSFSDFIENFAYTSLIMLIIFLLGSMFSSYE